MFLAWVLLKNQIIILKKIYKSYFVAMEMRVLLFTILVAGITSSPVDFTSTKTSVTTIDPTEVQQEKEYENSVRIIRSRSMGKPNPDTGK
jgi:hypothetical protein